MEDIAPPMRFILEVEQFLISGLSLRAALTHYSSNCVDEFAFDVNQTVFLYEHGQNYEAVLETTGSDFRRAILELICFGLRGESILPRLQELKEDIRVGMELEMEEHMQVLPLKLMLFVLIFMVPGYLLLLFGPILNEFTRSFEL